MKESNNDIIKGYILAVINKFKPKNEEFIHSCLFLINNVDKRLKIKDWYYNGYSILSETISSIIKELCDENVVSFSEEGSYKAINTINNKIKENLIDNVVSISKSVSQSYQNVINRAINVYLTLKT